MSRTRNIILTSVALLALGACGTASDVKDVEGQFWQRVSVSEAIYQQGPKAQQMLNRDISRCVVELRELERLGMVKDAIPTDYDGRTLDPDEVELYDWDSPERDKHLYAEHSDYLDFESCMADKGWERVEYVPFDVADKGRDNYLRANVNYDYMPEKPEMKSSRRANSNRDGGDFSNLND